MSQRALPIPRWRLLYGIVRLPAQERELARSRLPAVIDQLLPGRVLSVHLKNFSLLVDGDRVRLSPAYDLLNTTIALPRAEEELALPLRGRKRRLTRKDLVEYYGEERLGLTPAVIEDVLNRIERALPRWEELIAASFLTESLRDAYRSVIEERRRRLGC